MKKRSHSLVLFLIMILVLPSITCTWLKPKSDSPQRQPGEESTDSVQPDDTTADLPEATGDEIEITQTTAYQDEFGYWNLHGLLTNIAEYPVGNIELEVQLAGVAVGEPTFVGVYGIAPGEVLPFGIRLPLSVSSLDGFEVNILQIRRVELNPAQLETGQFKLKTTENGIVTLVGEVQNNTNSPALIYSTKAGLFSADGGLITTATCQVCPGYLTPDDKAPAQFLFFGHPTSAIVDHYEIYAPANEAPSVVGLVIVFNDPIHAYTDSAGGFHVLGDLQNNSEKILALQLVGTFYNQGGEIVGASSYTLPINSLLPGESAPYEIMMADPFDTIEDWSIRVELALTNERKTPAFQLSNEGKETIKEQYQWVVAGNAVNDSGQPLSLITVVVGLRETETGKLVGLAHHIEAGGFPAGESIAYSVNINPDPAFDPGALEEFILLLGE